MTTTIAFVGFSSPDIQYSDGWGTFGNHTHKGTTTPGSFFTFDFNGTDVWVAGTLYPLNGKSPWAVTFAVDGQTPPALLIGPDSAQVESNTGFFDSGVLTAQKHTLTVQVTSATTDTPFLLDQLLFVPSSSSAQQPSQSQVTYSTTTPPQVTVTVSAAPDGAASDKKSVPTGAIVGGVVAGVVVLAIGVILAFFMYRRRRNGKPYFYSSANAEDMLKDDGPGVPLFEVKPYLDDHTTVSGAEAEPMLNQPSASYPGPQSTSSQSSYSQSSYASSVHPTSPPVSGAGISSTGSGAAYNYTLTPYQPGSRPDSFTANNLGASGGASRPPPPRPSPNQPMSKAAQVGLLSAPRQTTYHADSGIRFDGPSGSGSSGPSRATADPETSVPADVPPSYTPN